MSEIALPALVESLTWSVSWSKASKRSLGAETSGGLGTLGPESG